MPRAADLRLHDVAKTYGATPALRGVSLEAPAGTVTALLGPSGCGKTTLLRTIAGLERPDRGTVACDGRLLSGPGCFVAPERRRVGMVFQDGALFPHLTVERNVAFGLPRRERRGPRVARALALVGLEGYERRLPAQLSGGQQQRVALARALAPEPDVILLDEPFSSLDAGLRTQVRTEVRRLLVGLGITTVFVTHDQEEALSLGDQVAILRDGLLVQQGSPADLYAEPGDPWVAVFLGDANLLPGQASGRRALTALGAVPLAAGGHGPVQVLVRPEEIELQPGEGARVEVVEYFGHDTVYELRLDADADADADAHAEAYSHAVVRLRARAGATPRFRRGDRVAARYRGHPTMAYPLDHPALVASPAGLVAANPAAPS